MRYVHHVKNAKTCSTTCAREKRARHTSSANNTITLCHNLEKKLKQAHLPLQKRLNFHGKYFVPKNVRQVVEALILLPAQNWLLLVITPFETSRGASKDKNSVEKKRQL